MLVKEFGMSGREVFQEIDELPLAAASLAQVQSSFFFMTLKPGVE